MAAIRQNGLALQHASVALRADEEVVKAAAERNWNAFQFAMPELRAAITWKWQLGQLHH